MLPTVLKIGPQELTGREEQAYRQYVEKYILNNATTILGMAARGKWAGLCYNFLGIGGPDSTVEWLRYHYLRRPLDELTPLFRSLFTGILKPWYGQPGWEPIHPYAEHNPLRLFPGILQDAEKHLGISASQELIECEILSTQLPNPYHFLKHEYPRRRERAFSGYRSITHGDLNMQNILVDERENLYVIDFSETRYRSAVSDFARLEPILKIEMTRLETEADLGGLLEFELGLAKPSAMSEPPELTYRGSDPMVAKAFGIISLLRDLADRVTLFEENIVPYLLAVLEWTYPVVSYGSASLLQKKLAAWGAAIMVGRIRALDAD